MNTNQELAIRKLNTSLASTSLDDLVRKQEQRSLLLVDVSGSMARSLRSGQSKIDALRAVVKDLRETNPVAVVAFGISGETSVAYVDDIPDADGPITPMHTAIAFAHGEQANHVVMVTDGIADSQSYTMEAAKDFARSGGVIDVFYIGDGGDEGAKFAQKLAKATGGTANVTDIRAPKQLATKIKGLLGEGTRELPSAIEL